ncbi:MAG: BrnA antitoxin family protein [Pseudomonadota bacterium]
MTEKGGVWQALACKNRITEGCFEGKEGIIKGDYQPQRKSPFFEKGGDSLFRVFCIPEFKNEDEEHEFWAIHSPLDYFDSSSIRRAAFPNLKPYLKSISIRVPSDMLAELKNLANKKDVPYQSLAKVNPLEK